MIGLRSALRIRRNRSSAEPRPAALQINITGRCPCRCWHCEKSVDRNGTDLGWDVLTGWLDQAVAWACPVLYSGGEPLVHERWRDLLQAGRRRGIAQKLITSGATFPRLDAADRNLLAGSLEELLISLDSADPGTHDRLRGRDGLAAGIDAFLAAGPRPPTVWLVHVPSPDLGSVAPMIARAAAYGVGLIVQPYIFASNYPDLEPLAAKAAVRDGLPARAAAARDAAVALAAEARRRGVVTNLEEIALYVDAYYAGAAGGPWFGRRILDRFVCSIPWQQVTIDEHGAVQPCVFLPGTAPPPGADPAEHWRRQAVAYRRRQLAGETWPVCRSCSCHVGANFRNSLLLEPWANRAGWGIVARKRLRRQFGARRLRGRV